MRLVIADANARLLTTFARLNTLIRSQQEQLRNLTGAPDEASQEIGRLVASCIQSLQFEDIVSQILERTGADLHQLGTVMKSVRNAGYEEAVWLRSPPRSSMNIGKARRTAPDNKPSRLVK